MFKNNKEPARHSPVGSLGAKAGRRICLITSVYKPYVRGGAESVVTNIVDGFQKTNPPATPEGEADGGRGHQIFVITICPFQGLRSLWPKKYIEDNLVIYRFYPLNLFSYLNINKYKKQPILRLFWHGFDMFNLHSYFAIKHILKKEKPNIVMTHVLKGIGYLTCRAVKSCKIKNVHTLHDVQLATPSGLILKGEEDAWQHKCLLTKLFQFLNRWLLYNPEVIISSSNFLLEFYNQRGFFKKSKKIILTNPINIKTPNTINPEKLRYGASNKQGNNFNFLFLGQVEKYKGVLLLIKVFKKLLEKNPDEKVNLLIVGTGSALEEAKKIASTKTLPAIVQLDCRDAGVEGAKAGKVKFLGYIPNQELNKIFAQANATIVSSLCYENSPTVIFESLSYGVPVLAARIGGIEFIKDNYNGFTFEAGDADDLLKILKFSLENKSRLKQMSVNCQESVKKIGVGEYIKKLEELF